MEPSSTDFAVDSQSSSPETAAPEPFIGNPNLVPDALRHFAPESNAMAFRQQTEADGVDAGEEPGNAYMEDASGQDAEATEKDNKEETVKENKKIEKKNEKESHFILYKQGDEYFEALDSLLIWVNGLLVPVYGRETSSQRAWCPVWWEHIEAVAQFYGLWMAWQEFTGKNAALSGPAVWHRDYLAPVMDSLRDPNGPFAGCKPGQHRTKDRPIVGHP